MKNIKLVLILTFLAFFLKIGYTQDTILTWNAKWITHPTANLTKFGVYNFRRVFSLPEKPDHFIIHISADNRYRLFVNGTEIGFGPARGDLGHWRYETYDIASFVEKGSNIIAVRVHNEGADKPMAQVSSKTAFILMADSANALYINTGIARWKVEQNAGYTQISNNDLAWWNWAHGWYNIGGTDKVNGSPFPWGWETPDYNDSSWLEPRVLSAGDNIEWVLEPRLIPMMEEKPERFVKVARTEGILADDGFIKGSSVLAVPPNSTVKILLDMGYETIGYPELKVNKGKLSNIKLTYAEALFNDQNKKENRNEIAGKNIQGYWDIFIPEGGNDRLFRPLWMRAFRYVQLDITTSSDSLFIVDFQNVFTAYPFTRAAEFICSDTSLQRIWDVSWRTMRLCATETNFDCPYYEQLNYEGDTRIQSMIALYTSGDDRLMKDAIRQFSNSFRPGRDLCQGAYPSTWPAPDYFFLPVYSLYFIGIVHDYFMNRKDDEFVKKYIPEMKMILEEFHNRVDGTKMLGSRLNSKDWNFVDWSFSNGTPDGGDNGNSALLSLEYLKAIQEAVKIFSYFGNSDDVNIWQARADKLKDAVNRLCYDAANNMYAETPLKNSYSQHTNILAILTDAADSSLQKELIDKVIIGDNMTHCSLYYKYYLFRALSKTGSGDQYLGQLGKWREMLNSGLSTFGETDDISGTRSDCHGWSASPAYDFLATIGGIQPAEPGFKSVRIAPFFGDLSFIHIKMPHPAGMIELTLNKNSLDSVSGTIILPSGLTGNYYYKNSKVSLHEGTNNITGQVNDGLKQYSSSSTNQADILFYPNPAVTTLNIAITGEYPNPVLIIYDILGRIVLLKSLQKANSIVSIINLADGNYFCNVISNGLVLRRSIITKTM